ncbi:MAG: radical SAM protein [Chloroflexi bacterium]|nr:radical SAM protein [Chloroflexota bacterium]
MTIDQNHGNGKIHSNGNGNIQSNGNGRVHKNGSGNGKAAGTMAWLSQRATEYVIGELLAGLAKAPESSYGQLAGMLEKISGDDENKLMVTHWVQQFLSPGQPGAAWLKHLLTSVDPSIRKRSLGRFIAQIAFRHGLPVRQLDDGREIPVPATVIISPTMRCNLRCVGCYAGNYTKQDDLTEEEVVRVIGEARELGTRFFVITGGEPFIYEPLFDIVKEFDDCFFQVYTSGHLLTEQKARQIVELGNMVPAISIEGFEADTDWRRGPGGFQRVMRAMDILREAKAMFAFSATVTQRNLETVISDEFASLMVEKGAHYGWYFSYMPIGRSPDLSLMPTPQQRNQLREGVIRIRKRYPLLVADFWNDGPLTDGCLSAGRNYLHINNRGDVEPCVFQHFAVDNIKEKPLAECLASDFFTAMRKGAPYGKNLLRPCPIIDHPRVLRGLVKKYGARPTHDGAETILTDAVAEHLDNYSAELARVMDPVWAREYRWVARFQGRPEYDWGEAAQPEEAAGMDEAAQPEEALAAGKSR